MPPDLRAQSRGWSFIRAVGNAAWRRPRRDIARASDLS
jgi:hypothetical protein